MTDPEPEAAQPTFEKLVTALLQVDPKGITGQTGKDKKAQKGDQAEDG